MIVVVQTVVILRGVLFEGWNWGAINEEEVRVSIVVVIDQSDARDHCFGLVLVRSRTAIFHKVHTGLGGDVFKTNRAGVVRLRGNYVCAYGSNGCRDTMD